MRMQKGDEGNRVNGQVGHRGIEKPGGILDRIRQAITPSLCMKAYCIRTKFTFLFLNVFAIVLNGYKLLNIRNSEPAFL